MASTPLAGIQGVSAAGIPPDVIGRPESLARPPSLMKQVILEEKNGASLG